MINLYKSKDKKFYYTVTAKNGKVLVVSETYNTRSSMVKGYTSLLKTLKGMAVVKDFTKEK
jgi:uncharacterized protein YegP (UPF0339 family)